MQTDLLLYALVSLFIAAKTIELDARIPTLSELSMVTGMSFTK